MLATLSGCKLFRIEAIKDVDTPIILPNSDLLMRLKAR